MATSDGVLDRLIGSNDPDDYRKKLAMMLAQSGLDSSPIRSPTQGYARMAQALLGGLELNDLKSDKEKTLRDEINADRMTQGLPAISTPQSPTIGQRLGGALGRIFGGGDSAGAPAASSESTQPMAGPITPATSRVSLAPTPNRIYDNNEPSPLDPPSGRDRDLAIRTIYGEAAREPAQGQAAVANVIRNRAVAGIGGDNPTDVVTAKNQFEPWNTAGGRARMMNIPADQYDNIGKTVDRAYSGLDADPTGGASHFYAPVAQAALGRNVPAWAQGQPSQDIGGHRFIGGAPQQPQQMAFAGDPQSPMAPAPMPPPLPAPPPPNGGVVQTQIPGGGPMPGQVQPGQSSIALPSGGAAPPASREAPRLPPGIQAQYDQLTSLGTKEALLRARALVAPYMGPKEQYTTDPQNPYAQVNSLTNERKAIPQPPQPISVANEIEAEGTRRGWSRDQIDQMKAYQLSGLQHPLPRSPEVEGRVTFNQHTAEKDATAFSGMIDQGNKANVMLGQLTALKELQKTAQPGSLAPLRTKLQGLAEYFGADTSAWGNLPDAQAIEAVANHLAPTLRTPGVGQQSNFELDSFLKSIPGLSKTPGGNIIIADTLGKFAERRVKEAEIADRAVSGDLSRTDARRQIRELGAVITPDDMKSIREGASEQTKPPGAPQQGPQLPGAQPQSGGAERWERGPDGSYRRVQ